MCEHSIFGSKLENHTDENLPVTLKECSAFQNQKNSDDIIGICAY